MSREVMIHQLGASGVDVRHLIRSAGSPADIAALDERYFHGIQICDAIGAQVSWDYIMDVHNREVFEAAPATVETLDPVRQES